MSFNVISHKDEAISGVEMAKMRALEIIGMRAEKYAKALCPVDTGNLRNSISHQTVGNNEVHIGTNVEYAPYVEFGTVRMSAKPYLRPAVSTHIEEYKNILKSELKNA